MLRPYPARAHHERGRRLDCILRSTRSLFGLFIWIFWCYNRGIEFLSGYITEKALSVDNLFVFALIIGAFQIPRKYQQKVLLFGIAIALILRGIFIALGAAVISAWSDVFYLFAIFLLYTAFKTIYDEAVDKPPPPNL